MTLEGNYQDLANLQNDILIQQSRSAAFAFFNKEKIKNFFSKNKMRLEIMEKNLRSMQQEHVLQDEHNEFKKEVREGREYWVFKTDADRDEY